MNKKWKHISAVMALVFCLACAVPAVAASSVNINTATAAQLEQVKGIGETLAERIVEYRKKHGDFKSLDALTQVKGIGEMTLKHFRGSLSVGKME